MLEQAIAIYEGVPPAHAWRAGAALARRVSDRRSIAPPRPRRRCANRCRSGNRCAAEHWRVGEASSALGAALFALGRMDEAEAALTRGYQLLRTEFGGESRRTCIAAKYLGALYDATARAGARTRSRLRRRAMIRTLGSNPGGPRCVATLGRAIFQHAVVVRVRDENAIVAVRPDPPGSPRGRHSASSHRKPSSRSPTCPAASTSRRTAAL